MASDDQQWIVKPDEARIDIAVGPDAQLSPELRAALDQLAQALETQQDVQGYIHCEKVSFDECKWYMTCTGVTT
jgi:hypothetical protein